MEVSESLLTFSLVYEDREVVLQLSEYYTVEFLKIKIHKIFGIPPHQQKICGWKKIPENENTILQVCAEQGDGISNLTIRKSICNNMHQAGMSNGLNNTDNSMEAESSIICITKLLQQGLDFSKITFHSCTLGNAINEACFAPLENRKALLLYLHNEEDRFSSAFCENLNNPEVSKILKESFFLLGWSISESKYETVLVRALNDFSDLSDLTSLVTKKIAAAILIVPINNSLTISSVIMGKDKNFLKTLKETQKFLIEENEQETKLQLLKDEKRNENDFDSTKYHQLMADMLGDRDYDSFEYDEHDPLKKKIAYSLLGPIQSETGYDKKEWKGVEILYEAILKNNNKIAKYKDKVEISFIYNLIEPLPSEKLTRAKKYDYYNPNTDLRPIPVFVLRKCRGSENPCRLFIDNIGRVYETWEEYITRNKLDKCEMVLPLNGRYEVDSNEQVLLERHLSPACGIDRAVLQLADYATTAGGIASGSLFVAAAMPSVTVAPALLLTAGAVGLGVGVYAIGRSIHSLYDRHRHGQDMSFFNSDARGAYLNILAGALGFVGAGANVAVSQLVTRGVNIGQGATAVVNTIGVVNIGVSGASLLNSGYDVLDQWIVENQRPSWLTIIQLSSSILFFGHAVYNFKMCSTIIEETQSSALKNYQDSLRSNRHRKTFSKLLKETIRQNNGNEVKGRAEVISAIRNIQNKNEVFAALTRSNKDMNKKGIRFAASDGDIKLNGVKIDMNEFMSMNKRDVQSFLLNLSKSEPTPIETKSVRSIVSNTFRNISLPDAESLANYAVRLLSCYNTDIKSKIFSALAEVLSKLTCPILKLLDEIFPNHEKFFNLLNMVVSFFGRAADLLEAEYDLWQKTGDDRHYTEIYKYINVDKTKRMIKFFEEAVNMYYNGTHLTKQGLEKLLSYFHSWLTKQVLEHEEGVARVARRREHSAPSPTRKIDCSKCGGYYYKADKS